MPENVLVLAVHPDDETLGCGGTLLKHKAQGDHLHWLIATAISSKTGHSNTAIMKRADEIKIVSRLYGFDGIHPLDLPTTAIDTIPAGKLIQKFSRIIESVKPQTLYLPFSFDVHSDHRIAFEAIYSCTKSFRYPSVKRVYMMETSSETDFAPPIPGRTFTPNCYVDITPYFNKKLEIAAIYECEMGNHPFPRSPDSLRALAMCRGTAAGCRYAEGFMMVKEIR